MNHESTHLQLSVFLTLMVLAGCSSVPVDYSTSGFHAPGYSFVEGGGSARYLLWSPNPYGARELTAAAVHELSTLLLQRGATVVERGQVERIFNEQRFRLIHTPAQEADLLRVGQMVGATQVIFVDADQDSAVQTTRVSVRLRSVDVQTGAVRWMGAASASSRAGWWPNPAELAGWLAKAAWSRAVCPFEHGWTWGQDGTSNIDCYPPAGAAGPQRASAQPTWQDLQRQELAKEEERLTAVHRALMQEYRTLNDKHMSIVQERVTLDAARLALDQEKSALEQDVDLRARTLADYQRRVAEFTGRVDEYARLTAEKIRQVDDYNRRLADYQQRVSEHNRRVAEHRTAVQQTR